MGKKTLELKKPKELEKSDKSQKTQVNEKTIYIKEKIVNLSEKLKNSVDNTSENTFNLKELTTGNKVWKSVSAFFALVFSFILTLLLVLQIESYPDYLFSLWLFIIIEFLLILFVIWFLFMLFDGLCAQFNKDKYYVSISDDSIILRENNKVTILPWEAISEYKVNRREQDNFVTSIKLFVSVDELDKTAGKMVEIPHLFADNFNEIYGLVYHHYQINFPKEKIEEKKEKSWPIVIGLSIKNENLPQNIAEIVTSKPKTDQILYFEAKKTHFWEIFVSLICFLLTFGFVMTIFDFLGITAFWGLELLDYNYNIRIFAISLLVLLSVGALAFIVINLVKIIKSTNQTLIITKQGIIEKVFDIVYVIPWASVKEITTKWFNYGAMHDKGELKIQLAYSEKPKGKANRLYNIQGEYHIEPNKLLGLLKEHWGKK